MFEFVLDSDLTLTNNYGRGRHVAGRHQANLSKSTPANEQNRESSGTSNEKLGLHAIVKILEDHDVGRHRGAQPMAPDLIRTVGIVVHGVKEC